MQRWHDCNGLPVHHYGGHKGSVFAYEEEINQWLAGLAAESSTGQPPADEAILSGKQRSREMTLTALGMWETRSERNIHTIADLYRKAIADDPCNSAAYSGMANAMIFCALNGVIDCAMAYPSALEALRRMPQLDSEHLDAKCSAAWIDMLYHHNWGKAREGFKEIITKRPTSFALAGMVATFVAESKLLKARECAWEAWRLNPLVGSLGGLLAWAVYLSGDFHQVLDLAAQIRSGGGDSSFITAVEALVLLQSGPASAHLAHIEKAVSSFPQNHILQGILGYLYGISGEKDNALRIYEHLLHHSKTNWNNNGYALALVAIGMGRTHETIAWLEAAYFEGALWSLGFRSDPILRSLTGNPGFERLVIKIGDVTHYAADPPFQRLPSTTFLQSALVAENS